MSRAEKNSFTPSSVEVICNNIDKNTVDEKGDEVEAVNKDILQTSSSVSDNNRLLKKEVQKLYEILLLRKKKKPMPDATLTKEKCKINPDTVVEGDSIDFTKNKKSNQANGHFEERRSFWRRSVKRVRRNKSREVEECVDKKNDTLTRVDSRKTCIQSTSNRINMSLDERRNSLQLNTIIDYDLYWDSVLMGDTSAVSFREKITKLKKIFKSGLKLFKKTPVTEL